MVRRILHTEGEICPLCERPFTLTRARGVYGVIVCRRCWARFVNRRQAAFLLDVVFFWLLIELAYRLAHRWLFGAGATLPAAPVTDEAALALGWVLPSLLFALKEGFSGYSLGKRVTGLRVIDRDSREPIGFGRSLKRNLGFIIPVLPVVMAVQISRGPRLGDRWANTMVVLQRVAHRPPFDVRGILCLGCGYDLTGNVTGRCPECGLEAAKPLTRASEQ